MSGGKKQTQKVTTYYAGMHMILCNAPIDSISLVQVKEKTINPATITGTSDVYIDQSEIFGGLTREGGVRGTLSFLFGNPNQTANAYLSTLLGSIPAYRGVVSVILNKLYLGTSYYMQTWRFFGTRVSVREKGTPQWQLAYASPSLPLDTTYKYTFTNVPVDDKLAYRTEDWAYRRPDWFQLTTNQVHNGWYVVCRGIIWVVLDENQLGAVPADQTSSGFQLVSAINYTGLINAVHVIRECLTDTEWGLAEPENQIDENSFLSAAVICYNEGLGFSWIWDKNKSISDFIHEVAGHINAVVFRDRKDNLWKINLIRKIWDLDTLPILTTAHVKKLNKLARKQFYDLTSQYLLKYESNITFKEASTRVSDPSLAARQGKEVLSTGTFSGVATPAVAQIIAARELKTLSTPVYVGSLVGDRTLESLNPGDAFILQAFDALESYLVLRVISLDLGTNLKEAITVEFTEDSFEATEGILHVPEETKWTPIDYTATPVIYRKVFESPYYIQALEKGDTAAQAIAETSSFIRATAVSPSGISIDCELWDTAASTYEFANTIDFQFSGLLAQDIDRLADTFFIESLMDEVTLVIGSFLYLENELIYVTAFDFIAGTLTVLRGTLDTVPDPHLSGSRFIQVRSVHSSDETEYLVGETIKAKLLTETPNKKLLLADAPEDQITLIGRMHRPYPPGDLRLDGVSWLAETSDSGEVTLSWSSRNRLQQTTSTVLDYYAASVTSEGSVTYNLNLYLDSNDVLLYSSVETGLIKTLTVLDLPAGLSYPAILRVELNSENLTGVSFQTVKHVFTMPIPIFKADDGITQFTDNTTLLGL